MDHEQRTYTALYRILLNDIADIAADSVQQAQRRARATKRMLLQFRADGITVSDPDSYWRDVETEAASIAEAAEEKTVQRLMSFRVEMEAEGLTHCIPSDFDERIREHIERALEDAGSPAAVSVGLTGMPAPDLSLDGRMN